MKKKKLLVISPFCPYESVRHAGGKIHFHYLKKLDNIFDLTVITLALLEEKSGIESSNLKADLHVKYKDDLHGISKWLVKIENLLSGKNPFDYYGGFIEYYQLRYLWKAIRRLYHQGYRADCVILDWTQAIFLSKKIRRLFPSIDIICVEQDVTYLKYWRIASGAKSKIKHLIHQYRYKVLKKRELTALSYASEIICLNEKDKKLLIQDMSCKISVRVVSPYYDSYKSVRWNNSNRDIIFFGAMARSENYESAIWFIKYVLPLVSDKIDRFIIIGNNPHPELLKYASDKVLITGFVEDITPYLSNSLCFSAPLVMGAGIKIKILEAMSSGIPVITNKLGIEGIDAVCGKDYLLCDTAESYRDAIVKIIDNPDYAFEIGKNGKLFIESNFNFVNDSYINLETINES